MTSRIEKCIAELLQACRDESTSVVIITHPNEAEEIDSYSMIIPGYKPERLKEVLNIVKEGE